MTSANSGVSPQQQLDSRAVVGSGVSPPQLGEQQHGDALRLSASAILPYRSLTAFVISFFFMGLLPWAQGYPLPDAADATERPGLSTMPWPVLLLMAISRGSSKRRCRTNSVSRTAG